MAGKHAAATASAANAELDLDDPRLYADLEQAYNVSLDEGLDNIVVVDNVPQVPEAKEEKLRNVIRKTFSQWGALKENGVFLPRTPDPENPNSTLTKGFAFLEFETAKDALHAVKGGDNFRLDRTHVFTCNLFVDIDRFQKMPSEFTPPEPEPYNEREHLRSWLLDPTARDQFVIRYGEETSVYYASRTDEPEKIYSRPNWTDSYVLWSPRGTYLTTFHRQGIAIWGGASWKRLKRFPHERVRNIQWSPDERYVITLSQEGVKMEDGEVHNAFVWDVKTGKSLRSFPAGKSFKWSHDDKYLARIGPDAIFIYELPGMGLLDKKSVKIEGVQDFEWSPTENTVAYWTPEAGNTPARVTLLEIPSRTIKRTKNLFGVQDCKLHWHPDGDFFAVKVDRHTKTKKSTFTSFELFRIREKEIPVEVLELKDPVVAFAWEPQGDKFALVHGEGNSLNVSFYSMEVEKKAVATVKLLKTLERKSINHLYWCPKGQFIVLAGLRNFNGVLEFWNIKEMEQMATAEHFRCSDVEWDPTGRYVTTSVSYWQYQMENGYNIWDFRGKQIYATTLDKYYLFLWRPRPPSLLSKEQMKNIRKNLKEYSSDFVKQDNIVENKATRIVSERRRRLMDEWLAYRRQKKREYDEQYAERTELRGYASDEERDVEVIEELVEEVIDEKKLYLE